MNGRCVFGLNPLQSGSRLLRQGGEERTAPQVLIPFKAGLVYYPEKL